ncbi:MAG TPA: aldo/keto reductase [Puia sp.]|nr:aldo/keto reductase [Puia sp.]
MNYHALGSSPLRVSAIGFGCMSLGKNEADNTQLILRALEGGINFFDTADLYDKGWNEQLLGNILHSRRDQVVLATKVGNRWRADGSGWDWDPRKEYIIRAAEASLSRLRTDRIDLYQLHGGTLEDPIDETIEAFQFLQQQGKILHYGISSIRPNVIREYIRKKSGIVSVMLQYSLLDRRAEETLLPLLQAEGIGVLARGPLAKGLLVNKSATSYLNYGEEEVARVAGALHSLSGTKRSPGGTALQFVLENPAVTSAVTGLRTRVQLEDVLAAMDVPWLTEKEMDTLRGLVPVNYYDLHR